MTVLIPLHVGKLSIITLKLLLNRQKASPKMRSFEVSLWSLCVKGEEKGWSEEF